MSQEPIKVFLVEDNPGDAHLVERYLSRSELSAFTVERADRVGTALERLPQAGADIVLLDLTLPDSNGIDTFQSIHACVPSVPIVVMTGLDDKGLALQAVREGAQDYLVKRKVDTDSLVRSIRYGIERKRAQEALRETRERYELAVSGAKDGVWDWNLVTDRVYFSNRWKEMLGYENEEIGNRIDEWFGRVHPADLDKLKKDISSHLTGRTPHLETEHRLRTAAGEFRWMLARGLAVRDENEVASRMAGSLTDIDARKMTEQQLLHDAMHDALTGLANSALLMDRLAIALAQAKRRAEYRFAVLFLDLDRFKAVNDSLGHAIGDQLLIGVALRLQTLLRPGDTVARLGGDEFAILANGIESPSDATRIAERIHEELRNSFDLKGHEVSTTASIGIALSSTGYDRPQDLLRDADTAMYRAKYLGKARHAIFDEEMHHRATELLNMEAELRRALKNAEFRLHYQPIVNLVSGELEGFEALVRWQHPQRGLVLPGDFIQVAEETGLIVPIGWAVMREACGQMATWHRQLPFTRSLGVSVNLSTKQFQQADLIERIEVILYQTGFDPARLQIEVTERLLMSNVEGVIAKLRELRELGVQLYIDDFGTGFSSMRYLHQLPTQTLKIDRSFVSAMNDHEDRSQIVGTIISLARSLGMQVAAEGLETPDQLARLQKLECEYGQGFYFSRPLDSEETRALIASHPRW